MMDGVHFGGFSVRGRGKEHCYERRMCSLVAGGGRIIEFCLKMFRVKCSWELGGCFAYGQASAFLAVFLEQEEVKARGGIIR